MMDECVRTKLMGINTVCVARAFVCVCVRARACVCVCEREREGERERERERERDERGERGDACTVYKQILGRG